MSKLFLKRSQAAARGTGVAVSSTSSSSSSDRRHHHHHRRQRNDHNTRSLKPMQGSEAVAVESQKVNAKTFHYPPEGFETWIEHSLLYTMIRESDIFPAETVLQAIDEEDYTPYFFVKQKQKKTQQPQIQQSSIDDLFVTNASTSAGVSTGKNKDTPDVSYAQLTALLALAGEEWPSSTEIPQRLCKAISKQIIKYAYLHDLDRQQELKELLDPLIQYANARGRKQSLQMLPWFAALTVSVVNPLAFYSTYMAMLAVNGESMGKRDRADRNTIDMAETGNRHGNVEKASLLDEDHYKDFDE